MNDHPQSPVQRPRAGLAVLALAFALVAVAGVALARASVPKPTTLGVAKAVSVAGRSESIVTNSRGLTVYTLSGETTHHLKCTRASGCLPIWVPVTVRARNTKLSAAHGIPGRVAVLHRDGLFQVTLGGHPLYTFAGDGARKRSAAGQGIVSFGGTWKVIALRAAAQHAAPSTTTSTTTSTTSVNPYGY